jgi:hypothetical protein
MKSIQTRQQGLIFTLAKKRRLTGLAVSLPQIAVKITLPLPAGMEACRVRR